MHYRDLRDWIAGVESFGELRVVEGADWNQEIGAVAEVAARSEVPPAVLFDKIKGYPAGRANVHPLAEAIHLADMYCAMISSRADRKPIPANKVARELFLAASGDNASEIPAVIIKQLGIYPPGIFVKLANGEVGIVVRRGATAKAPKVCGLQDKRGAKYSRPTNRDTTEAEFAVVDALPEEGLTVQINPVQLFGYPT